MSSVKVRLAGVSPGMTTLEALDEGRPAGHLSYAVLDELVGRHAYVMDVLVEHPRRAGIGTALLAAMMEREPGLRVYVAPRSRNSPAGNAFFTSWNARHQRKVRWHAEVDG